MKVITSGFDRAMRCGRGMYGHAMSASSRIRAFETAVVTAGALVVSSFSAGAASPPRVTINVADVHVALGAKLAVNECWTNVPVGWVIQVHVTGPPNYVETTPYSRPVANRQGCVVVQDPLDRAGTYHVTGELWRGTTRIRLTGTIDVQVSGG